MSGWNDGKLFVINEKSIDHNTLLSAQCANHAWELIRCKDCKKRNTWDCWWYFFGRVNLPNDYYCPDGKPKDGEHE